jgi:hypothetical protein
MKKYLIYLSVLLLLFSCSNSNFPPEMRESLSLAGANRAELEKVLAHYTQHPEDSLKLKAAYFLIANMKWHGYSSTIDYPDATIRDLVLKADSVFTAFSGNGASEADIRARINEYAPVFQTAITENPISAPYVRELSSRDVRNLSAEFLIAHIEHSFERWNHSPYARHLTLDDFCETILPYRAVIGNSMISDAKSTFEQMGRQLKVDSSASVYEVIDRYNFYLNQMRTLLGKKPVKEPLGYYEIFFNRKFECDEQCEAECNILRACGIPAAIDINVGNRDFVGQHHHCVVFDSLNIPNPFSAEASLNGFGYNADIKLNIYRSMFGAQKDSPRFLKKAKEQLPANFKSPCIKEVTPYLKNVYPLHLPLQQKVKNQLVWLCSYANNIRGMKTVTWGIVDNDEKVARFSNVVAEMLYFPCLINSMGQVEFLMEPQYAVFQPQEKQIVLKPVSRYFDTEQPDSVDLLLTRKFPYKESMKELAQGMVGGKFYGANSMDGSDQKELYTITAPPGPYLNEYIFHNDKAWKYYIYQAPGRRWADISILEWLAESSRGYENAQPATPLEIFRPEDKTRVQPEWVKLAPRIETHEPEYDGNMQTASTKNRIVFEPFVPSVVSAVRMAPKNADNIIKPEEDYELMVWENNTGWESLRRVYSQYNYLEFKELSSNRLYWLRNHSRGKEEVPFIIREGKVSFIYYDVMNTPEYGTAKLDNTYWTMKASSEETNGYEPGYAQLAFDNDPATWWHSQYAGEIRNYPHWIQVDTQQETLADGIFLHLRRYEPKRIKIEVSSDNRNWIIAGNYVMCKKEKQRFDFQETLSFRHFRVTFLDGYKQIPYLSVIELSLFKYD